MAQFDPLPLHLFRRNRPTIFPPSPEKEQDSLLLKAIKSALRGTGVAPPSTVHSSCFYVGGKDGTERELTWNDSKVILTVGGVVKKKWSFELEGQPVQWACIGWMEESASYPRQMGWKGRIWLEGRLRLRFGLQRARLARGRAE